MSSTATLSLVHPFSDKKEQRQLSLPIELAHTWVSKIECLGSRGTQKTTEKEKKKNTLPPPAATSPIRLLLSPRGPTSLLSLRTKAPWATAEYIFVARNAAYGPQSAMQLCKAGGWREKYSVVQSSQIRHKAAGMQDKRLAISAGNTLD